MPRDDLRNLNRRAGRLLRAPAQKHPRRARKLLADRYRGRPLDFIAEYLGITLWSAQRDWVVTAYRDHLVTVKGGVGVGKDLAFVALGLFGALVESRRVLLCAGSDRQVAIMMREIRRIRHRVALPGELFQREFRVDDPTAGIIAFTLGEGDAGRLTGWHSPAGVWVFISEAEAVPDSGFEAAISNAVDDASKIVAYGNPLTLDGYWPGTFDDGSPWTQRTCSVFDFPNLTGTEPPIKGGPTPRWVDERRREWGERSALWTARVLGEFPVTIAGLALFGDEDYQGALERHRTGAVRDHSARWTFGIDVALEGGDATIVCAKKGREVRTFHELRVKEATDLADVIIQLIAREHGVGEDTAFGHLGPGALTPNYVMRVDAVGNGIALVSALLRRGYTVHGIKGSSKSTNPQFLNARAQSYFALQRELRAGKLAFPPCPELRSDMLATTFDLVKDKQKITDKKLIRRKLGRSPDYLDSLVLATTGATVSGMAGMVAL